MYRHFLSDIQEVDYQKLPSLFKDYFEQNQCLPSWIDWDKVELVHVLYKNIGAEYASALILSALPIGYSSLSIVKLLSKTGYLASNKKTGTAKRLLETAQFLFNMMTEDCFERNSVGMKHILKVRFIHAMVRFHLKKHSWDISKYGLAINQEDMALTILTFSLGAIKGLERMNIPLTLEQKDAIVHFWALVGHLIGVQKTINPLAYASGDKYYEYLLLKQAKQCPEGIELTRCLADFVRASLPSYWLPKWTDYTMRYLIASNYYSDIIGLEEIKNPFEKLSFYGSIQLIRLFNRNRQFGPIQKIVHPANRFFTVRILDYFDKEFNLKLHIPLILRQSWGLDK